MNADANYNRLYFFIERIAIKIKPTAASKVSGFLMSPRDK